MSLRRAWNTYPYTYEASRVFGAMTTQPSDARKKLINALIVALISADLWTKLDGLYLFAAADAQASLLNWKNPGTFDCTNVNSCTFTGDVGYTGNASNMAVNTNFNPATAGGNFVQNSASFFGWSNTVAQVGTGALLGRDGAGGVAIRNYITPRHTDNNAYYRINVSSGTDDSLASTDGSGLWLLSRTASAVHAVYRNGASVDTGTVTSGALESVNLAFLQQSTTGFSSAQILCGGMGSSMDATNAADLYNALHTYLQAVAGIA